jgi:hypothetical protein
MIATKLKLELSTCLCCQAGLITVRNFLSNSVEILTQLDIRLPSILIFPSPKRLRFFVI